MDKILQLMPGSLSDVRERGQLYEQLQHYQAAAEDYRYYLERMGKTTETAEVYRRLAQIQDVSLSHYWIH